MSERKTAEIKFRVTPSEKAAWQARADQEEIGLSELIRTAMALEQERRAERATLATLDIMKMALSDAVSSTDSDPVAPTSCPAPERGDCPDTGCSLCAPQDASPQEDVPTSDEVGAVEKPVGLRDFISTNVLTESKPLTREDLERYTEQAPKPAYPWQFNG